MLGIIYLILCFLIGREWMGGLPAGHPDKRTGGINRFWLVLPASFGVGVLVLSWGTYLTAWIIKVCTGSENPLFFGNLFVMCLALAGLGIVWTARYRRGKCVFGETVSLITDRRRFRKEAIFFGILLVFLTWIMFYVFHVYHGVLYSGFTVYGDYAPHTAMMRSFSRQCNFPTQYPHYGGEDVKYHFMFQFLAGNLEYLGLRIDFAYNIPSILSLWGFLMMLYQLAPRITGGFGTGILSVLLFFFRSGLTFFRFVWEHFRAGDLWEVLKENTSFIGYTMNENWGLWNFNVYLNQRHLAFGLLIVCVTLWIYLDWVEAACRHEEKGLRWLRGRLFTRKAWFCRNPETALVAGLLLGLCSFWNGAAVIGGLLILMGFGIFSDGKLDYAITAFVAVGLSVLQSKIFINGQAMEFSFYWGFLAEDKSLAGVGWYLFQMSGFFFLGMAVLMIFLKRRERICAAAFLIPLIFALCISLTPDINVNHKYVMISYAFLTMFWAWMITKLWRKAFFTKCAAVMLVFCLTVTGIYDFVVILKDNDSHHRVGVQLESSLTDWLEENLTSEDLLLTPQYSMNEVTMAGVMLYCGWPYYAWSAGYDTNYRAEQAVKIYTSSDIEEVRNTALQEGISYILFEEGMEYEQQVGREDVISKAFFRVYCSENGTIRIYKVDREEQS